MDSTPRYEIVSQIATGDFATVYKARDRELGREVAIKEIHPHFRSDPQQLERYWREAQLLASLQHPHIITIYDIVRSRGWIILELMRGNLQQSAETGPIDLDFLRDVLCGSLQALEFLHANGVIHGDIKPSNLLLDVQGRVKLGDFGLARRATDAGGSLVKGTTKYMAPELISDQFGAVGPPSDLYSLGFTAYELICGPDFELLFPSLGAFGRDQQVAWMMWHSAADQQLPKIDEVLEGVPPDVGSVVDGLVVKDQSKRIRSAREALRMLPGGGEVVPPPMAEEEDEEELARQREYKRKRLRRVILLAACVCSLLLSILMLLPPQSEEKPAGPPPPQQGQLRDIFLDERLLVLLDKNNEPIEVHIKPSDEVYINGEKHLLRDLEPGDRITVETHLDEMGMRIQRLQVVRPETASGTIQRISLAEGTISLVRADGETPLVVQVPQDATIEVNGQETIDGRPVALSDLKPEDRVRLEYSGDDESKTATSVSVLRQVTTEGVVRDVNTADGLLTVERSEDGQRFTAPLADNCTVTINDRTEIDDQLLKPSDLRPGDRVTITYDTKISRVDAYRVLGQAGTIQHVNYGGNTLSVQLADTGEFTQFLVEPDCEITLGGETAGLEELRPGDRVDISHDSPGDAVPTALRVEAVRPADPDRWAVIVALSNYDDDSIPADPQATADAEQLHDVLLRRYAVPRAQLLFLEDPSRVRLRQAVSNFLANLPAGAEVLTYYAGRAISENDGEVYLAARDTDSGQLEATGIPLQWLVDQLEASPAKAKLLVFDGEAASDPSMASAELLNTVEGPPGMAPFRTVTAIASPPPGEPRAANDGDTSRFGDALARAYRGEADTNRDAQLEPTELYAYLKAQFEEGQDAGQTPQLFLPDDTPPRLTEGAKQAISRLASLVAQDNPDRSNGREAYRTAEELSEGEPEPVLLYGLFLIRTRQTTEALAFLEQLKIEQPDEQIPYLGLAWLHLLRRSYGQAVSEMTNLLRRLPPADSRNAPSAEAREQLFFWLGQLREYVELTSDQDAALSERLSALDTAVGAYSPDATAAYKQGREQSAAVASRFDEQIAKAPNHAEEIKLTYDRRQLSRYTAFPFDRLIQQALANLNR